MQAQDNCVNSRTLWIVTELYYPEETSTGYYLTRIAEGLVDDFEVKIVCGQPNYSMRGVRAPKHEVWRRVEIFRAAGTTHNKNIIALRLINIATLSLSVFVHCIFRFHSGDKVLVVTTPPSLPFIAGLAALFRGAAYTLLIHDNYPELAIAAKKLSKSSAIARSLSFFNRWLYKYASKIIVVGRDMKELLETKTLGLDIPIATIPNWAELETVRPEPREGNRLLKELGLVDKFIFLYAGNMGYPNDMASIISCAVKLRDNPNIHFIFLGTGIKESWLCKTVGEEKLQNVSILEPKPRSEQIVFLNACDVALVSLVKGMCGVSMPSRTYNILAAGKPILAVIENNSELTKIIDEEDVGWAVPPGEPDLLYDKVLEIYDNRMNLDQFGFRARKAAITKYSYDVAIGKYRSELC